MTKTGHVNGSVENNVYVERVDLIGVDSKIINVNDKITIKSLLIQI